MRYKKSQILLLLLLISGSTLFSSIFIMEITSIKPVNATTTTNTIDLFSLSCSDLQQLVNKLLIPFYYYGFNSGNPAYSMQLAQIYLHIMDEKGCPY